MGAPALLDQLKNIPRSSQQTAFESEDFLAWLAYLVHEVRNPLATIEASLKAMELEGLSTSQVRASDRIRRQVEYLARLAEDLGAYSSRKFDISFEPVEFEEVWREVREAVEPELAAKSQRLLESVDGCGIVFPADRQRLVQIFTNLLRNASKYSPEGARMMAECKQVDGHLVFCLRDKGIGIPEEELPHVFEMFYRGSASERGDDAEGSGLGLAITRRFVELHGGTIEARSNGDGEGAEFMVRLPLASSSRG